MCINITKTSDRIRKFKPKEIDVENGKIAVFCYDSELCYIYIKISDESWDIYNFDAYAFKFYNHSAHSIWRNPLRNGYWVE